MTTPSTLPEPPPHDQLRELGIRETETLVIDPDTTWWRIHQTTGNHVIPWNTHRTYGPILRFDPHPPPPADHPPTCGIWYGANNPDTALAETFQVDRTIDRHRGDPYLTGLTFTRPLTLLDLTTTSPGAWATRTGGNYAISTGPHTTTQHWARAITAAFPDLDGLRYNSRFAGHPCIALFHPATTAMPTRPTLSLPLTHPDLTTRITGAAHRLGYTVI